MSKKQRVFKARFAVGSWFLNRGVSLAQRACKPYTQSIDYDKVHKLVNKDTVIKYNPSIARELDLRNENAIKSELCDLFLTCFTKDTTDKNYPKVTSKTWQVMIGIKPTTKTPIGAFRDIVITMFRDILEAKRAGTLENIHITKTVNYLFARRTPRRYGHDKRVTPKAMNDAVDAGLIHKGFTYTDDEGNTTQYVKDPRAEEFIDQVHMSMLVQQVYERLTDPRDKESMLIYYRAFTNKNTIAKEYLRKQQKYQALGLRTPAAVRQRVHRLPQKYLELKNLNPYR